MGSRISFLLSDVISNPKAKVALTTVIVKPSSSSIDNQGDSSYEETNARLRVDVRGLEDFTFSLDWVSHKGVITLSADFNIFRYSFDSSSTPHNLMRALYELSVPFEVIH